jgi:hypothetical protein
VVATTAAGRVMAAHSSVAVSDPVFALKTLLAPDVDIPLTGFSSQVAATRSRPPRRPAPAKAEFG